MPFLTYTPQSIAFNLADSVTGAPWIGVPVVLLRKPGGGWLTPSGAVTGQGDGFYRIAANTADQDTEGPLLVYATSADAGIIAPSSIWVGDLGGFPANTTAYKYPFWFPQLNNPNAPLLSATGIALLVSLNGAAAATPGSTTVAEVGHGFYEWTPAAADVAVTGQLDLGATAAGAFPFYGSYYLLTGPQTAPTGGFRLGGAGLHTGPQTATLSGGFRLGGSCLISPAPPSGGFGLGGVCLVTSSAAFPGGGRERDIRNAVHDLLMATHAFDEVWLPGMQSPRGKAASDIRACAIDPKRTTTLSGFDAAEIGAWIYRCQIGLTVVVRNDDEQLRDETAEQLLNLVRNALDGVSLGGITLLEKTWVGDWTWLNPQPPERKIQATLTCEYLEEGWEVADVTE
jgi:hypothetical protein